MFLLKSKIFYLYVISILFLFAFTSSTTNSLIVAYIKLPIDTYFIAFTVIVIIALAYFVMSFKTLYIDVITILLYFRMVIYLIPVAFGLFSDSWGNYILVIADLLIYFIASQNNFLNYNKIVRLLYLFALVISVQVIITFIDINNIVNYFSIAYKSLMIIPIGASNFIACIIIPITIATIAKTGINKKNLLFFVVLFTSIVLIKSRGAFLIVSMFGVYSLFTIYKEFIRHNKILKLLFVTMIIGMSVLVITQNIIPNGKQQITLVLDGYSSIMNEQRGLNTLSSGRIDIFSETFDSIIQSPLWGHGASYQLGQVRSHNIILDILYQSGILGLFLFLSILYNWFSKVRKYKNKDEFINFSYWFCMVVLIQSLFEINLINSIATDFLFFTILGLSMSKINNHISIKEIR